MFYKLKITEKNFNVALTCSSVGIFEVSIRYFRSRLHFVMAFRKYKFYYHRSSKAGRKSI